MSLCDTSTPIKEVQILEKEEENFKKENPPMRKRDSEKSSEDAEINELAEKLNSQGTPKDGLPDFAKSLIQQLKITLPENETIAMPTFGSEHRNVLMVLLCKSPDAESEETLSPVKNEDRLPTSIQNLVSWIKPRTREEFIFCDAFPHKTSGKIVRDNQQSNNLKVQLSDFEFAKRWLEKLIRENSISIVVAFGSQTCYVVHSLLSSTFKIKKAHLSTNGDYQFSKKVKLTKEKASKGVPSFTGFYFPHPNAQGLEKKVFEELWKEVENEIEMLTLTGQIMRLNIV